MAEASASAISHFISLERSSMVKTYSDLEYLQLTKFQRFIYKLTTFFLGIPGWFKNLGLKIWAGLKKFGIWLYNDVKDLILTFKNGDWKTRLSYIVMGSGSMARGQWLRGVLFFLVEAAFIFYMVFCGGHWLSLLPSLGLVEPYNGYVNVCTGGSEAGSYPVSDTTHTQQSCMEHGGSLWTANTPQTIYGDNSFKILLYGVLTIFFIVALIYTWRINIKQNRISQEILATGKPIKSTKDDLRSLIDNDFHKTLLALPTVGIVIFMVLPIFFMILVAFTNYDGAHDGYNNALWQWVGWDNFATLFGADGGSGAYGRAFWEVLGWTLLWAFLATFTNYFLGMFVAIMINKKGIRLKKLWRTILVLTIAIPQFISLLYVSKMFADNGIIIGTLKSWHWIAQDSTFSFIGTSANPWVARLTVVVINIWIGIPYLMLISTGILMNIPADLYESARVDGANVWQQYTKITMPYMLFVTGPYLLTQFIGNMNNFNVIYLLTSGGPTNPNASGASGSVGYTDLLVTWLFKITTGSDSKYYMASVIGIFVFIVAAVVSLVVYNIMPSTKNEEDYQ